MREQVIASRPSRRAAVPGKGFVQKPARRDGRAVEPNSLSVARLFGYLPTALKLVLGILTIVTLIVSYRVASSASMFQVQSIDVVGTSRTSADEIEGLVRRAVSRTGVWRADLKAISAELTRLPGVRRAVVTRVLPDRLRVRVTERVPIAVVRTSSGHFVWVDEEGVALGEMKASDQVPPFFIHGWNEDGTADAGKENAERVQKYLEAVREWQTIGLAERVSEIDLIDVRDVRAQLSGKDSQIEVRLGSQDLGSRLKTALDVLDEYKQTPRGALITYVELQGDRVILGTSSGSKVSASSGEGSATPGQENQAAVTTAPATPAAVSAKKPATPTTSSATERVRGRVAGENRAKESKPRAR